MSDYKRLVAYIYLYDGKNRTKNIGFTKVESKNGECRMQVHVKGAWLAEGEACEAYIFYREKTKLKGISIGSFSLKNGEGELRAVTKSDNIMESGLALSKMAGIVMQTDGGRIFATRWDDGPVSFEDFVLHGNDAETELVVSQPEIPEQYLVHAAEAAVEEIEEEPENKAFEPVRPQNLIFTDPTELLLLGDVGRYLVNNSFLLHGFYNYGHLLLNKVDLDGALILGVPGDFCMQEKIMASLFGFPEFKAADGLADNSELKNKNTGYWLRRIENGAAGKIHESGNRPGKEGV